VFERKVASGAIVSAVGRAKWESILRLHLIPAFGDFLVDKITRELIEQWKTSELLGAREAAKGKRKDRKLESGRYSPGTANTVLGVLRQITAEASRMFNIRDVAADVENVSTRGHRTYTYEEPNSIKPEDVPRFLAEMRCRFPNHYAFVFLGFTTGLRPSSLRPLRRRGSESDVKWEDGKLLVRRSQTKGSEVMDATKTDRDQVIDLDPEQLSVLRWHVERLDRYAAKLAEKADTRAIAEAMQASELLFPSAPTRWSKGGGFRSRSCLDKPFAEVAKLLELGYDVSPRAMRRTFQDLARAAKVHDVVTRAISGHATETMQRHYSSVNGNRPISDLA
jgi:integrase